jgi:Holliday junction DNA helicase RuvA
VIYKISGNIISKEGGKVAIDLGSIAFEVFVSMNSYAELPEQGKRVELFTHFVMREDGVALYGFTTNDEKLLFLKLNTVSKIGPKMALAILGSVGKDELITAITAEDVNRLSRIPGIGRKTAERIIVELKDKLKEFTVTGMVKTGSNSVRDDVISALCGLGYKLSDSEKAVASESDSNDFQTLLKKSLSRLAGLQP